MSTTQTSSAFYNPYDQTAARPTSLTAGARRESSPSSSSSSYTPNASYPLPTPTHHPALSPGFRRPSTDNHTSHSRPGSTGSVTSDTSSHPTFFRPGHAAGKASLSNTHTGKAHSTQHQHQHHHSQSQIQGSPRPYSSGLYASPPGSAQGWPQSTETHGGVGSRPPSCSEAGPLPPLAALQYLPAAPAEFYLELMAVNIRVPEAFRSATIKLGRGKSKVSDIFFHMSKKNKLEWKLEEPVLVLPDAPFKVKWKWSTSTFGDDIKAKPIFFTYQDIRQLFFVDLKEVVISTNPEVKLSFRLTMGHRPTTQKEQSEKLGEDISSIADGISAIADALPK